MAHTLFPYFFGVNFMTKIITQWRFVKIVRRVLRNYNPIVSHFTLGAGDDAWDWSKGDCFDTRSNNLTQGRGKCRLILPLRHLDVTSTCKYLIERCLGNDPLLGLRYYSMRSNFILYYVFGLISQSFMLYCLLREFYVSPRSDIIISGDGLDFSFRIVYN